MLVPQKQQKSMMAIVFYIFETKVQTQNFSNIKDGDYHWATQGMMAIVSYTSS